MPAAIACIANPAANGGGGLELPRSVLAELTARRVPAELYTTTRRGHAGELAQSALAGGATALLACGGDGTVQEVARVAAEAGVPLALGPTGRCNDFARALGASADTEAIVAGLLADLTSAVDLVHTGVTHYCTVGAVGFDAAVSRYVDEMSLPLKGTTAYMYAVLRVLPRYRPANYRLEWDGGSFRGPLLLIAVANTPTYGNGIPIVPRAMADDGVLRVLMVQPAGFFRVAQLLPTLLRGAHENLPEVSFFETSRLTIESDEPVELWADGEPVGWTPLDISVQAGALKVINTWGERPGPALALTRDRPSITNK